MPNLRTLGFVLGRRYDALQGLLRILTHILPDLHEVLFLTSETEELECTDQLHELFHNFVLARAGTLTRMSIPRMKNVEGLYSLKDYIPRFEVRYNLYYLITLRLSLICFAQVSECSQFPLFF
jgi:hypothetical protein